MAQITRIMVLFVIVLLTGAAAGQGIRSVAPNGTGLSTERLDRIGAVMKDHVDKGHIAGAIGLIARRVRLVISRPTVSRTKRPVWRCGRTPSSACIR